MIDENTITVAESNSIAVIANKPMSECAERLEQIQKFFGNRDITCFKQDAFPPKFYGSSTDIAINTIQYLENHSWLQSVVFAELESVNIHCYDRSNLDPHDSWPLAFQRNEFDFFQHSHSLEKPETREVVCGMEFGRLLHQRLPNAVAKEMAFIDSEPTESFARCFTALQRNNSEDLAIATRPKPNQTPERMIGLTINAIDNIKHRRY